MGEKKYFKLVMLHFFRKFWWKVTLEMHWLIELSMW